MIQVALVGCGHMGRHHARTVATHPDCRLVAAVDIVPDRAREVAALWGAEARADVPDGVDVVIVATPTTTHVDVALPLLASGRWCLVEKPVAASLAAAAALASPRLAVGHVERHNPALRAVGPLSPTHVEARRLVQRSGRSLDVDVVTDLMIHDLDLVLAWATGPLEVDEARAHGFPDTAGVRLRGAGLVADLVASRVSPVAERTLRITDADGTVLLDLLAGRAFRNGVPVAPPDDHDALRAQWDAFLDAVRADRPPAAGHDAAARAIGLVERIRTAVAAPV